jgi:hypothetical protein
MENNRLAAVLRILMLCGRCYNLMRTISLHVETAETDCSESINLCKKEDTARNNIYSQVALAVYTFYNSYIRWTDNFKANHLQALDTLLINEVVSSLRWGIERPEFESC